MKDRLSRFTNRCFWCNIATLTLAVLFIIGVTCGIFVLWFSLYLIIIPAVLGVLNGFIAVREERCAFSISMLIVSIVFLIIIGETLIGLLEFMG